jgi:[protein-PII] uridylyltransferase
LIARLRRTPAVPDWCELHTCLVDDAVRSVFERVSALFPSLPPIAIVGTGGYGRKELAPYSDVDLTVIPLDEASPALDGAVRELFQGIHQVIGGELRLEIGYAYRLVNDAPALDEKSRTGLLDARLIAGSPEPLDALLDLYWNTFPIGEFLISKIDERLASYARFHDTPLVVEPQLKEGAGGLRCFQAANWLRAAIGERPLRSTRAYEHVLNLRNLLHLVCEKRQDVLSRQRQAEIADLVQQDVYGLMSEHASHALELSQEFALARERLFEARFSLGGGVVALRGEARISTRASASAAAAGIAKATRLRLRVPEEEAATTEEVDGAEVLFAISAGEKALRNLDRAGLLRVLLPELAQCKTLMPQDSAHVYTVYEHTFRVIRHLDELQPGTFLGDIKASLREAGPLYLAALLHDVGKADPSLHHSESGARMAAALARRWGLAEPTADLVEWLVREHLTMARFIGMRDVMNPQTTHEFAAIVRDQERLDLLTLLTYADVSAVSKETWTPAQDAFLRELYERTTLLFQGEAAHPDTSMYRKRLLRELRTEETSEQEVQTFLESLPAYYLSSTPPDLVRLHLRYVLEATAGRPVIELFQVPEMGSTELTVCCQDQPGLLSRILGVIYAYDLSIHGIRASTTHTDNPVALDVFTVSFGGRPVPPASAQQLTKGLRAVLEGSQRFEDLLRDRGKDPNGTQHNFSYTYLEGAPSILEVQAPRGRGMAYRLSRLISQQGWNITAARVGQWAGRGAAAFYILGPDQQPVTRSDIERALSVQV